MISRLPFVDKVNRKAKSLSDILLADVVKNYLSRESLVRRVGNLVLGLPLCVLEIASATPI